MTLVSVVIPAYRAADFIEETLRSVEAQSWRPLQLVLVDDASDDATAELAMRFADERSRDGFWVDVVRHEVNKGAAAALSTGVAAARGEFVGWLSADDLYVEAGKTDRQIALFTHDTAVVFDWSFLSGPDLATATPVTTGWSTIRGRRTQSDRSSDTTLLSLMFENPINGSSVLMRKSAIDAVGGFDAELRNVDADADLWMRLSATGWSLKGSPGFGIFYRVHAGQTSADTGAMQAGTAMTRVRMLAALQQAGRLDRLVRDNAAVFASAFRNRLHRSVPLTAHALATGSPAARRSPWLMAMRVDLARARLAAGSEGKRCRRAAESLLDTAAMSTTRLAWTGHK